MPEELIELSTDPTDLQWQLVRMEPYPKDLFVLLPGHSRHFTQGVVLRYMVAYDDGNNRSGCVGARQGRYTLPTFERAKHKLDSLLANNSPDRLALYGGAKSLFVRFTACYGRHYDPAPVDLGCTPVRPADLTDMRSVDALSVAILKARRDFGPGGING